MGESPEQRVARLEAELARARAELGRPVNDPRFGGGWGQPDTLLAAAPRPVPLNYRLLVVPFSWFLVFVLLMVGVAPIAVWIFVPLAGVITGALTFVLLFAFLLRRAARRNALLKWGEVAHVLGTEVLSQTGASVENMRVPQAQGWTVERRSYSGPVVRTRVDYELRGTRSSLTVRGLPYRGGVILADSRDPRRALCVSSIPFPLERDAAGDWTGHIRPAQVVGAFVMLDLLLGWTAAMVVGCGFAAGLW